MRAPLRMTPDQNNGNMIDQNNGNMTDQNNGYMIDQNDGNKLDVIIFIFEV